MKKTTQYNTCPDCGAHLDPCEVCECKKKSAPSASTLEADNAAVNADKIINNILPQNKGGVKSDFAATIPWGDLEDFVITLQRKIKCAETVMHEIAFGYLNQTEEAMEKNNYWHLWGNYNEYSTKADIVTDYLYSLRQLAEKAEAFIYPEEGGAA